MRSRKRVLAAVMAVLLAAMGIGALVLYANSAQERAFAGRETVSVLRVTERVPVGTKASALDGKVEQVKLPRAAVPEDFVKSLDELGDKPTVATLVPGEVLVDARFVGSPGSRGGGTIEVPNGLQEVTLALDSVRALGGTVQPGDRVGVLASYESPKTDGFVTNFAVNNVLIVGVSGGVTPGDAAATGGTTQVRLALQAEDIEKVVNAAEFGKVWLSRQPSGAKTGRNVVTPEEVVQ